MPLRRTEAWFCIVGSCICSDRHHGLDDCSQCLLQSCSVPYRGILHVPKPKGVIYRYSDPSAAAQFAADNGAAGRLARLLSHSVEWQPNVGGEGITADAVNQIIINVVQGLDRCAALLHSLSPAAATSSA